MLLKLLEWLGFGNPIPVDLRENTFYYYEYIKKTSEIESEVKLINKSCD